MKGVVLNSKRKICLECLMKDEKSSPHVTIKRQCPKIKCVRYRDSVTRGGGGGICFVQEGVRFVCVSETFNIIQYVKSFWVVKQSYVYF